MSVRTVEPALLSLVIFGTMAIRLPLSQRSSPVAGTKSHNGRQTQMKDKLLKLSVVLQILMDENGQDLIEYALVVALIAFAAKAGLSALANQITGSFIKCRTKLTAEIT